MLKGKTALITGSTSGIGYGVALQLARQGCRILFNGFGEPQRIAELQKEYSELSGQPAQFWGADLSQPSQIATLSSEIPVPDILVNNAGIQHTASIGDFPVDKWDAIIAINLSAAFHLIQQCLPTMRQRGWGRLINIASVHGLVASVNKAGYVAAKHGLIGLTKVVALEEARSGVTCNAICPGWVLTPLVEAQIAKKAAEEGVSIEIAQERLLGEKQPSLRFTTPQDLGDLVTFLCGSAASNITGSSLTVDGGWTAQ